MPLSEQELRSEIARLAPWHLDVQVTPTLSTAAFLEAQVQHDPKHGHVSFLKEGRESFQRLLSRIYPSGLAGKSMLDCACNGGGYSFWAKELGAERCFGFDVRQHWIDQAQFLLENRQFPSDGIEFKTCDLLELSKLGLEPFDVCLFKGIFYHLPDPIGSLKTVADLTREVIILNTATRSNMPDGALVAAEEDQDALMNGVYNLNWFPTGPEVLTRILNWLGFPHVHVYWWLQELEMTPGHGRIEIIAARDAKHLSSFPKPQS